MACTVPKRDRTEYVQNLVLDFFQEMEGKYVVVTLDTSLGRHGLGHTMVKRKTYHAPIKERLAVRECAMQSLKPNDFADSKLKTIGDVAAAVEKDLV
jgi:hypothetical protein